ncbi:hypothetical protein BH09SUM1_BH09SUM1_03080 [soil metagenome]
MQSDQRIIGIDLGTTNSVVAIVEGGEPVVIPNQEGANKTPSVVAFLDNNDCIVGEIARRQAATNPIRTITSIKRFMGVRYDDLEEWVDIFPFEIVDHEDKLLIDINGFGYSPEQISALILKKLKESAEAFLGQEVKQAVITVPAHFDDNQRNSTIEAAKLAGLEVLRLINEPTAAALAYGIGKETDSEEIIAIYDFGGGTFDITILEISGKTFEVLTSTGDNRLGGDDLDNTLVGLIVEEFEEQHGVDLKKDPVTLRRLKEVAEKAKCELSTTSHTTITLPFIAYKNGAPLHLERQLSRQDFEEMIEQFVNRTIRCCKRAIEDAGLSKKDINKVILVGGSTRVPLVQDAVEDFFGLQPFKGINPDEVVALGAATQAGVFSGNIEEVTLLDVAPHSLGIEVKDGKFSKIIEKNATIPIKAAKNFTTTEDNQAYVNVHILQGESDDTAENRSLGKFTLSDIPPQPKGRPRVRVTFFVNADGVMEISAEELGSGIAKTLTILHNELDEGERKQRKKARQKRAPKQRAGKSDDQPRRYSPGSMGAPKPLQSKTAAAAGAADSSTDQKRRSRNDGEDKSFALLGDTNPGLAPTASVSTMPSSELNPKLEPQAAPVGLKASPPTALPPKALAPVAVAPPPPPPPPPVAPPPPAAAPSSTSSQERSPASAYPAPQRYTRASSGFSSTSEPGVLKPAVAYKPDEQSTAAAILKKSKSLDELPTVIGDPDTESNIAIDEPAMQEVDDSFSGPPELTDPLPPEVSKAAGLAGQSMENKEAQAAYVTAMGSLMKEPWLSDQRFEVLHARAAIQLMMGQVGEMRTTIGTLVDTHGPAHGKEILALQERAIGRFTMAAPLRRDRARIRELLGDLEGACEDMEFASKTDPAEADLQRLENLYKSRVLKANDPAAQFKLVKIYLKSNRVDEAVEILQDLQHHDAYETRATKILGLCHWQKNLHFLAWQKFKQLKQNEEIRDILYRLGNDMETTGQLNNALTVYEHIASDNPEYRDVQAKIKKLRYRIKMHQDESEQSKPSAVLTDPRFTIIEEINRGSMGIIFKAKDKTLEEIVALKVLNDYLCSDPGAVERFKREARAAKKLSHPYIVRIHDLFETGSKRFISMEYIEGTDLKRMLSDRTSFGEDQLIFYFMQICDALSYAHRLNIIHRDIKPANVMITKSNNVKVTDFGIAKILKGEDSTKSGTAVIGTPLYMAPEQITGEGVDARSDIYALGIMMYELVSGHPPFYLGNIEYHHIHTAPPPLPERVSATLRRVIMKCVEKSPANRYQSVEEIFDALQAEKR